jgi:hypothetical protein
MPVIVLLVLILEQTPHTVLVLKVLMTTIQMIQLVILVIIHVPPVLEAAAIVLFVLETE